MITDDDSGPFDRAMNSRRWRDADIFANNNVLTCNDGWVSHNKRLVIIDPIGLGANGERNKVGFSGRAEAKLLSAMTSSGMVFNVLANSFVYENGVGTRDFTIHTRKELRYFARRLRHQARTARRSVEVSFLRCRDSSLSSLFNDEICSLRC